MYLTLFFVLIRSVGLVLGNFRKIVRECSGSFLEMSMICQLILLEIPDKFLLFVFPEHAREIIRTFPVKHPGKSL